MTMTREEAHRRMLEIMCELYNIVGHKADGTEIWKLLDDYYGDVATALPPPRACGGREPIAEAEMWLSCNCPENAEPLRVYQHLRPVPHTEQCCQRVRVIILPVEEGTP